MENYAKKEVSESGNIFYYNADGKSHRLDGPAIEWFDGSKEWYIDGKIHRLDGPALVFSSGFIDKYNFNGWRLNGISYYKAQHNRLVLFAMLEPARIILLSIKGC